MICADFSPGCVQFKSALCGIFRLCYGQILVVIVCSLSRCYVQSLVCVCYVQTYLFVVCSLCLCDVQCLVCVMGRL